MNISRIIREGRWTGHSSWWTDVAVLGPQGVSISRVEKAGGTPRRWLHELQTAVGSASGLHDVVWLLRMAGPQGLEAGRSLLFGMAVEKPRAGHVYKLDADHRSWQAATEYSYGPRPYAPEARLPSPPALELLWVAREFEHRAVWGRLLVETLMDYDGANRVAWHVRMPPDAQALALEVTGADRLVGWR